MKYIQGIVDVQTMKDHRNKHYHQLLIKQLTVLGADDEFLKCFK